MSKNTLESLYNEEYYNEHEYSYKAENREDIKRILELIKPGINDKVLDIGCGFGILLRQIVSKDKVGIETNDFIINECQKQGLRIIKADVEQGLPFSDASFDIIIMNEVLGSLKNPRYVLEECHRTLAPGGKIILTTPVKSIFFHDIKPTHYFSEVTTSQFRNLVRKSGFRIISHEVCGISFLQPIMENLLFKPFRFLRTIFKKKKSKKGVNAIDSFHRLADKTFLKPGSGYRKYFLGLGLNQIIFARKK